MTGARSVGNRPTLAEGFRTDNDLDTVKADGKCITLPKIGRVASERGK